MYFSSPLVLVLALAPSTLFALPTRQALSIPSLADFLSKRALAAPTFQRLTDGVCDLDGVTPALGDKNPLPPPTAGLRLYHVAVGRGTQNYTCASASETVVPVSKGAAATLFNATCAASRAPTTLSSTPAIALAFSVPTGDQAAALESGHHFFSNATTPVFNLDTAAHAFGIGSLKKTANTTAPADAPAGSNNMGSVAWLKLTGIEDGTFKEVYRVDTAGGNPPKNCSGISGDFDVEYSAVYWFYTS
ncbi:hypothetical protein BU16DRAFT_112333 [Lophium mytilinum]|uniref:Malate dehydrogenase n=1 Tax=Lophium mytilinum TaxID=390894 RepID=A0A6A6QKA2_9PEZI|nr:hypothetical protein BU16DRAFT_112333 [Lophium mytilinum]